MSLPDLASAIRTDRPFQRTPLGDAWRARTTDDTEVMIVTLAPELVALAPDRERLAAALRARTIGGGRAVVADDTLLPPLDLVATRDGRLALLFANEDRAPASARLGRGKAFATPEIAAAAHALGQALHAAHAAGERHGAIFPGLLYLGAGAPARLVGHGVLDAFVDAGAERGAVLAALGARAFTAPEVGRLGSTSLPSPTADVFALGATLYACMTGRPPFGGRTTALTMATVLADEGITGELPFHLPKGDVAAQRAYAEATDRLTQALLRAVERAPDDRWPSAADFVRALEPRAATPPASPANDAPRAHPSRLGCAASLVLLLGLASLIAALVVTR